MLHSVAEAGTTHELWNWISTTQNSATNSNTDILFNIKHDWTPIKF